MSTSKWFIQAVVKIIIKTCEQATNPNKMMVKEKQKSTSEQANNPNKLLVAKIVKDTLTS